MFLYQRKCAGRGQAVADAAIALVERFVREGSPDEVGGFMLKLWLKLICRLNLKSKASGSDLRRQ